MPATTTLPAAPPSRGALRIVLFGMPDAGKSSLLGALAQAGQTQEHLLNGTLTDRSQGLIELQRRLYEDRPRETLEEVTSYPVALVPRQAAGAAREAVLVDCDGRVANELLSRRRTLGTSQADGALARAILEADTLVLVVDASASAEAIERDFGQFGRFLRLLEQNRGQRSEVGGLPVYLVLTKCDLLGRATDSNIAWMERIEERKREVDRRFKEFLAGQADQGPLPFGKIELHLWATAVKRPALKDAPAKPREPYGVAELFRQCLDSAVVFRQRQARATRRLSGILTAVFALAGGMLLLILYFLLSRPGSETTALENEIRTFRSAHDRPAELLKEPVDDRLKQLQRFKSDADFKKLPTELQDYVVRKVNELEAYQRYNKEFLDKVRDPKFAKSLEELNQIEDSLKQTPLPSPYNEEWAQTRAAQRQRLWEQDIDVLRREVKTALATLTDLIRRSNRLSDESISLGAYRKLRDELLREDEKLPYRESERNRFLSGSSRLTYENVLQFDRVDALWREWKEAKQKIKAAPQ
jgi:50S ribosome-binding GTPase